jgi:hypothetical protein
MFSYGKKEFVLCNLCLTFRDAEGHIACLLQHGWHEKALAVVEAWQGRIELLDEVNCKIIKSASEMKNPMHHVRWCLLKFVSGDALESCFGQEVATRVDSGQRAMNLYITFYLLRISSFQSQGLQIKSSYYPPPQFTYQITWLSCILVISIALSQTNLL